MAPATRGQRLRRALLAGVSVLFLLLIFTAWQATQVRSSLADVASRMTVMVDELAAGRPAQAESALADARDAAQTAYKHSRGPVWWTAGRLPWIGDDVTAVRVVSDVARDLTDDTLPELVEVGRTFRPHELLPRNGRFDLAPVAAAAPALDEGSVEIGRAADRVLGLETSGLMEPLRAPMDDLRSKLGQAASASDHAAAAAALLPPMLGEQRPRNYLVIFQNNAEIRTLGGMPGALALLRAESGRIEMVRQGTPSDIGEFPDPFIELTAEEEELFTTRIATFPQDTVFVPDFPRSAELLKQMWERTNPEPLDGVISVDPVAMSYLLRGTGPLQLASGLTLTADNAVGTLMRDVYLEVPDLELQDAIFAETALRLFDVLRNGRGDPVALLDALGQAAGERRLMVWSSHPDEQSRISSTALAGELPTSAGLRPEIGVYLNDSAADKLSYYLDYRVDVTPQSCLADERQAIDVRLTMRSTVPEGAVLPASVVGPGIAGRAPGVMRTSVYVYAPVGGRFDGASLEGAEAPTALFTYRDREVVALTLDLEPGQERVVEYELVSGPSQTGRPRLLTTPAAQGTGQGRVESAACS